MGDAARVRDDETIRSEIIGAIIHCLVFQANNGTYVPVPGCREVTVGHTIVIRILRNATKASKAKCVKIRKRKGCQMMDDGWCDAWDFRLDCARAHWAVVPSARGGIQDHTNLGILIWNSLRSKMEMELELDIWSDRTGRDKQQ
jgi:hypothetical protein